MTHNTAKQVSHIFLYWAYREGDLITNLKLQKLLYYAQGWYIANFKSKILFDDEIEAWQYGPVVPEVYREFKKYKGRPIEYEPSKEEESVFSDKDKNYLKEFYEVFIEVSANRMVNSTHNEPPWKDSYEKEERNTINIEDMRKFFKSKIDEQEEE